MKGISSNWLKGAGFVALAYASLAHTQAQAQSPAPAQPDAIGQEGAVDRPGPQDIIVTAQRRAQSLQDVPVTVTVFSAEQIQDARIQQIGDIVTRTPGLSFDAFPATQPRLYIRGIGSADRGGGGDPSSAVFLDDIYLGRPPAIAFDAFDVERIEVLKGPQGTLFGRNVVGGAINVITRRPDFQAFDASGEITYGDYDQFDVAGFVNVPFARNEAAIRLSGAYRSHDGYVRNPFLGTDVDDQDTLTGRLQIGAEPSEKFRFNIIFDGTRDRFKGPGNHTLELVPSDQQGLYDFFESQGLGLPYTTAFDPDLTYGSTAGYQNRDTYGVRGEFSYDLPFATLIFLGSYRYVDYGTRYDIDGGNPDPTSPGFNQVGIAGGDDETSELSSQEVRLASLPDSPINWVLGFYHYYQDVDRTNVFNLDTIAFAPIELTEIYSSRGKVDSVAVFGDATIPITDNLKILGGIRYTKDKKTWAVRNTDGNVVIRADDMFDVNARASFDAITYRAGVEFRPAPRHLVYATVSRGFKSGGFQETPASAADAVDPYEPEKAVQYEIGQKSRFFNGKVVWNNTLYYLDYTDLQTRQLVGGLTVVSNAGKATIKGYETQFDLAAFDGFQLSIAYAYTDAKFDKFFQGEENFAGNVINGAPKHKVTVSPSYTYELPTGIAFTLAADYRHTSKIFDDNSNLPPEIRKPTDYLDARLIVRNIADHFSLSIWGKNLTDERERTFQGVFLGANFGAFSPPRTYGVTLSWRN